MIDITIELEQEHAEDVARQLYELPGVCGIITSSELMDAVAHGQDVWLQEDQEVQLQIRPSARNGIALEKLPEITGVKTVSGNDTLHEVME